MGNKFSCECVHCSAINEHLYPTQDSEDISGSRQCDNCGKEYEPLPETFELDSDGRIVHRSKKIET